MRWPIIVQPPRTFLGKVIKAYDGRAAPAFSGRHISPWPISIWFQAWVCTDLSCSGGLSLLKLGRRHSSLLELLDTSMAFAAVDLSILSHQLECGVGVSVLLWWFHSSVTGHKESPPEVQTQLGRIWLVIGFYSLTPEWGALGLCISVQVTPSSVSDYQRFSGVFTFVLNHLRLWLGGPRQNKLKLSWDKKR